MNTFQNAHLHYYSYFLLGWCFRQFWLRAFSAKRMVIWRKHEWMNKVGLHRSVTATSVSNALGKPSPVTEYIYSEIMTKKCTSSRQMKWRCKLGSHFQSHFGITSCLDKQHLLSLFYSWQVATVNTCIRDQSQQITIKFHSTLQEAAWASGEHWVKPGPLSRPRWLALGLDRPLCFSHMKWLII